MALVEIRRFYGPEEAQVAAGLLRANGIETLIQNEQLGMTDFLIRNATGGFRLWVPEEDEAEATALLPPIEAAPARDERPPEPERPQLGWAWGLRRLLFGR
jgi:hypothetical protein